MSELGDEIMPEVTGDWARTKSKEVLSVKVKKELTNCLESINKAVHSDEKEARVYGWVHEKVRAILTKRGFNVEKTTYQDRMGPESYTKITW